MPAQPLLKIREQSAAEVGAYYAMSGDAKKILTPGMAPAEFVEALIAKKRFADAIDFMAHALPAQDGIWWGCLCLQHAMGEALTPEEKLAATAVVRWVMQPVEENRLAAKQASEGGEPGSPAFLLALAVSLTAGSVHPPELPFHPPPPFSAQQTAARAVKLAAARCENIMKTQRAFVELALQLAGDGSRKE